MQTISNIENEWYDGIEGAIFGWYLFNNVVFLYKSERTIISDMTNLSSIISLSFYISIAYLTLLGPNPNTSQFRVCLSFGPGFLVASDLLANWPSLMGPD